MRSRYRSAIEARERFDECARLDARLTPLWPLCERAARPEPEPEVDEDVYDVDPYEADGLAAETAYDGWCAEDHFFQYVKPTLMRLVGEQRLDGPSELQGRDAYDAIYDALINWALHRSCACCVEHEDRPHRGDAASPVHC